MANGVELIVQRVALAHGALRFGLVVPETGASAASSQFGQAALRLDHVKDAQQSYRLLDFFDEALGFGAHDLSKSAAAWRLFKSAGDVTLQSRHGNLGGGFRPSIQPAGTRAHGAAGIGRLPKVVPAVRAVAIVVADHRIVVRRRSAGFEGFQDRALRLRTRTRAGLGVDADQLDAGRHAERHRGLVGQCDFEEVLDHRGSQRAAGLAAAERARLVVAIDAGGRLIDSRWEYFLACWL